MRVLKLSLRHNLNVDSAPFRQQLQGHLRSLLARVRDGCYIMMKTIDNKGSPRKKPRGGSQRSVDAATLHEGIRQQIG